MPYKDTLCPMCGNHIRWTPALVNDVLSGNFKCPRCNRKIKINQKDLH